MKVIHQDVRYLAVVHFVSHKDWKLSTELFQLSRASLYRFVKKYEAGEPLQPKHKTQPCKFSQEQRDFVALQVQKRRATVSQISKSFYRKFKVSISFRTVRRILKSNAISFRKVSIRRNPVMKRKRVFHKNISGVPVNRILSVDEMGFKHGPIYPFRSWCRKGRRNRIRTYNTKLDSYNKTVTCVISNKQVVHYEWSRKPMNTTSFVDFLRLSLIGYTGYHLILDNVSFHRSKRVVSVLQEMGITPIYIDPYSPEQNPIEEVFSSVKHYMRKQAPRSEKRFASSLRTIMCKQHQQVLTKYFMRSVTKRDIDRS